MGYYSQDPQQPSNPVPPPMPMQQTNTLAIVSLVFGILGLVQVCPGLGSIIALITGYMAKGQIKAEPMRYGGDGLATGGIILGWIGVALIVCGLCGFLAWLLFFGGMAILSSSQPQSWVPGLVGLFA